MKLWIGIEEEGVNKGSKTLFVGSPDITFKEIEETIKEHSNGKIDQIYFGAGCCTHINKEVLDEALDKTPINILKTVELNIINADLFTSQKYDEVNKIITINDNRFLFLDKIKNKYNYQLKIQSIKTSNKILWTTELNNFEETNCDNLEGKKYKDDVIVK